MTLVWAHIQQAECQLYIALCTFVILNIVMIITSPAKHTFWPNSCFERPSYNKPSAGQRCPPGKDIYDDALVRKLANAAVVFFTGDDQLRITRQMGDSQLFRCMQELYQKGATIVGTSAGAAAMPETMLVGGESDKSHGTSTLSMAPGLGLLPDVVVDSHFAERGRMGRLLGAVVQNPRNLGIGIDEDTAIVVEQNECFRVLGSGAVYIVDGSGITYSSLSEENTDGVISMDNVRLHVLGTDDRFDLQSRDPIRAELTKSTSQTKFAFASSSLHSTRNTTKRVQ